MKGKYAYPLLLVSGALLSLAFPEPDIAPLAWVALAPLIFIAKGESAGRGFLAGLTFGIGFFGALTVWISLIGWVAWGGAVLIEASFVGLFGMLWAYASRRAGVVLRIASAGAIWVVVVEYLRSILPAGGFTWGQLAQSQHDLGWMLRPAALGGGLLVAFLLVVVNALAAESVSLSLRRDFPSAGIAFVVGAGLVVAPLLLPAQDATGKTIKVAIVQGNVPREIPPGIDRDLAILESHRTLTEGLAGEDIDVVVWPESSLALDVDRSVEAQVALETAAQTADAPLLVGGNLDVDLQHYRVMAFQTSPEGRVVDRYQKTHLVPFGEYIPARPLFDWIPMLDQVPRDAIPGDDIAVFDLAGGPIAPVISYEGDFGSLVRTRMDAGGRMLAVLTNTSTWGESWASAQHVAFSQVRAAENGVWVIHAALSGISAFVAPDGEVQEQADLWEAATIVQDVTFAEDITFYARFGEWVPVLCALIAAAALGLAVGRERRLRGER